MRDRKHRLAVNSNHTTAGCLCLVIARSGDCLGVLLSSPDRIQPTAHLRALRRRAKSIGGHAHKMLPTVHSSPALTG